MSERQTVSRGKFKANRHAFKAWRKERRYSQMELAGLAGVSESVIGTTEAGFRNPSIENALRIAEALRVDVRALGEVVEPAAGEAA